MSISEKIGSELPYLRRFARAQSGSQESGDAYVVAMLEAIVADPSLFRTELPTKTAVYRAFVKVWGTVQHASVGGRGVADSRELTDQRLHAISSGARQAFLLVAVEGFEPQEAAQVMDVGMSEFRQLIDQAGREIAEEVATTVLIIEDEPLIALDLADIVTTLGHSVCATASTRTEAVAAFKQNRPGIVLADIQLADGSSGLDAVNDILRSFEVPVIFITAFPERLLTGSRPEPTFLINKPFQPEVVKALISQALFFGSKSKKNAA